MTPVKFCARCGCMIAKELDCDFYRYIRLRYCKQCAADVTRERKAAYMRRIRAQAKEAHKLTQEQNSLLKAENALLREAIRKLEADKRKARF